MWEKILNFIIELATSFGIKLVAAIFVFVVIPILLTFFILITLIAFAAF